LNPESVSNLLLFLFILNTDGEFTVDAKLGLQNSIWSRNIIETKRKKLIFCKFKRSKMKKNVEARPKMNP
jgi:hypothetical protein